MDATTEQRAAEEQARREAIKAAWHQYRTEAARLSSNRRLGWSDYLEADQRAWGKYLAVERIAKAA